MAEEKLDKFILVILIIGIILVVGVFMVAQLSSSLFTEDIVNSTTQTILSNSNVNNTLTYAPSSNFQALTYNQTYISFDGTSEFSTLSSDPIANLSSEFSLSIWVNLSAKGYIQSLVGNLRDSTTKGWQWKIASSNQSEFQFYANTSTKRSDISGINLTTGNWIFLGFTFNGTQFIFYVNSTQDIRSNLSNRAFLLQNPADSMRIGHRIAAGSTSELFNGTTDELRIYNRTLTQAEMLQIYNSGRTSNSSLNSSGLTLWLSFNENSNGANYDKSGFGNNATYGPTDLTRFRTDGINLTLTDGTDYQLAGAIFTILNNNHAFNQIRLSYNYDDTSFRLGYTQTQNLITGIASGGPWLSILILVAFSIVVIALLTEKFGRIERKEEDLLY